MSLILSKKVLQLFEYYYWELAPGWMIHFMDGNAENLHADNMIGLPHVVYHAVRATKRLRPSRTLLESLAIRYERTSDTPKVRKRVERQIELHAFKREMRSDLKRRNFNRYSKVTIRRADPTMTSIGYANVEKHAIGKSWLTSATRRATK